MAEDGFMGGISSFPALLGAILCYPWLAIINIIHHFTNKNDDTAGPSLTRSTPAGEEEEDDNTNLVTTPHPNPRDYKEYFDTITKYNSETFIYNEISNSERLSDIDKNDYHSPLIQRRHEIIKRILQLWSLKIHGKFYNIFTNNLHFDDPIVSYWNKNQFQIGFNTLGALLKSQIIGLNNVQSDIKENFFDVRQTQYQAHISSMPRNESFSSTFSNVSSKEMGTNNGSIGATTVSDVFEDRECVIIENYQNAILLKMSVIWSFNYDLLTFFIPKGTKHDIFEKYSKYNGKYIKGVINGLLLFLYQMTSITTHEIMILKLCKFDENGKMIVNHSDNNRNNTNDTTNANNNNSNNNNDIENNSNNDSHRRSVSLSSEVNSSMASENSSKEMKDSNSSANGNGNSTNNGSGTNDSDAGYHSHSHSHSSDLANNNRNKEYVYHIIELWNGKWFLTFYGMSRMTRRITAMITLPVCYIVSKAFELWMQFRQ